MLIDSEDETEISTNPIKAFLIVVGGVLLTLGAAALALELVTPRRTLSPIWRMVMLMAACGFGMWTIVLFGRLFYPKPAMVFSKEGIRIHDPPHCVPWSEIVDGGIREAGGREHFVLRVRDPAAYMKNAKSSSISENIDRYGSPIAVNLTTIVMNYDELMATFDEYYERYGERPRSSMRGSV